MIFLTPIRWGETVVLKGVREKHNKYALNFTMGRLKIHTTLRIKRCILVTWSIRLILKYARSVGGPYKIGEIINVERVQRIAAQRVPGRDRKLKAIPDCKVGSHKVLESIGSIGYFGE